MAEFERLLIQERVKAGLRNAKAKGKRLGQPRVVVDQVTIPSMRDSGAFWRAIAEKLRLGSEPFIEPLSGVPQISAGTFRQVLQRFSLRKASKELLHFESL